MSIVFAATHGADRAHIAEASKPLHCIPDRSLHAPWATKRPIETMGGVAKMTAAGLCWLLLGVVLAFGVAAASPETRYDFVVS